MITLNQLSTFLWQFHPKGDKTPHYFHPTRQPFFTAAGLYSPISPHDGMNSFTIITTEPNDVQKPVHDRMPAILLPEEVDDWLNPDHSTDFIMDMLRPYPNDAMDTFRVSKQVNNAKNNHPGLIQKAGLFDYRTKKYCSSTSCINLQSSSSRM